jgi:hypothetical protein
MKTKAFIRKHFLLMLSLLLFGLWGSPWTINVVPAATGQASALVKAPLATIIIGEPRLQQLQPVVSEQSGSLGTVTPGAKITPQAPSSSSNTSGSASNSSDGTYVTNVQIWGAPNTSVVISMVSASESAPTKVNSENVPNITKSEEVITAQFNANGESSVNFSGSPQVSSGNTVGNYEELTIITVHF